MDNLAKRLRQSGILFLIGFLVIIAIALGFFYSQQGNRQRELEAQIAKLNLIVSKPLLSAEKLQAEYDKVNHALSPMSAKAALDIIVGIAKESGIDVDPDAGKLRILPALVKEEKVGEGNYQVLSFRNIGATGDYDKVLTFISALDSGKGLSTMVLKKVAISQIQVKGKEEVKTEAVATLDVDIYTKPAK